MRRLFTSPIFIVLLLLLPAAFVAFHYGRLPEVIPVHFNAKGEADGFGKKATIWVLVGVMSAVSAGVYLLMANIHHLDPKKAQSVDPRTYKVFGTVVVLFLTIVQIIISSSIIYPELSDRLSSLIFALLGVLFLVLGFLMKGIKPNYFVGIRLPWTLEDPKNWAATHRITAFVWQAGGILIILAAVSLPFMAMFISFIVLVALMVIIPSVYSYRFFKRQQI
jgi:uncharacterized membrane protein